MTAEEYLAALGIVHLEVGEAAQGIVEFGTVELPAGPAFAELLEETERRLRMRSRPGLVELGGRPFELVVLGYGAGKAPGGVAWARVLLGGRIVR